jgi:hypothetical protein
MLIALAAAASVRPAAAMLGPSFSLDRSAVKATHVVVATEGERIDGVLTVLESWKGDLRRGAALVVPELARFAPREPRLIDALDHPATNAVSGDRMLLFLVKSAGAPTVGSGDGGRAEAQACVRWLPASCPDRRVPFAGEPLPDDSFARMRISVAWVERDRVFAFQQISNPGPTVLASMGSLSEEALKSRVLARAGAATGFERAAALPDPTARAEALVPFLTLGEYRARERAFSALAECGAAALPHLRGVLRDPGAADRHYLAVAALALAAGRQIGPELRDLLAIELVFWTAQARLWRPMRWNDLPAGLRQRHTKLEQMLAALTWIRFTEAREVAATVRDRWEAEPFLHGLSGGPGRNRITRLCNACLQALSAPDAGRP